MTEDEADIPQGLDHKHSHPEISLDLDDIREVGILAWAGLQGQDATPVDLTRKGDVDSGAEDTLDELLKLGKVQTVMGEEGLHDASLLKTHLRLIGTP